MPPTQANIPQRAQVLDVWGAQLFVEAYPALHIQQELCCDPGPKVAVPYCCRILLSSGHSNATAAGELVCGTCGTQLSRFLPARV